MKPWRLIAGEAEERREWIEALWSAGWKVREIARELETTPGTISVEIVRMRQAGWNLPLRRMQGASEAYRRAREDAVALKF